MTPEEMASLLEQRHLAHDTHHCPHGRPTALVFTKEELEKHLKEIAAVDSLIVRVSDGLVQIREKGDQRITQETLEETVTKAGFTLREMERIGSQ